MKMFEPPENSRRIFESIIKYVKDWCSENQWSIGIAEMAAGAAILKWGIQMGSIDLDTHLVATELSKQAPLVGGAIGGSLGILPGAILGSIGVAAGGTAIGIPAVVLIGGGALLLSAAGYAGVDIAFKFTKHPIDISSTLKGNALVSLGTILIVDGARRFLGDTKVRKTAASFYNGVLKLPELSTKILARSSEELKNFANKVASIPEKQIDMLGNTISVAGGAAAGATIGSSVAAASVTVFGSSTLGSLALSLGLVTPPLWPAGAAGAAGMHIFWQLCKGWGKDNDLGCENA